MPQAAAVRAPALSGHASGGPAAPPTDLELAALVSSRICHDIINPVGAIYNGLEMLDEDDDPKSRAHALDVIRNVTEQASARLKFARLAFGASGSAGTNIDLKLAEEVSRGLVASSKCKLNWKSPAGFMAKDHVKLLLNMVALSMAALLRGGDIEVTVGDNLSIPAFVIRCRGMAARPPQFLAEFLAGVAPPVIDSHSVQAYYTTRLADAVRMKIEIVKDGADIVLTAKL